MKFKLLFCIIELSNGGAERSLINLLNELNPDEYDVDMLMFRRGGLFENQIPAYVRILDAPAMMQGLYRKGSAGKYTPRKVFAMLQSKLHEKDPYALRGYRWQHYYSAWIPPLEGHYDAAVSYLEGEPLYYIIDRVSADRYIGWIHNDYKTAGFPAGYDRAYLGKCDAIVTISDECVKSLNEVFPEYAGKTFCLQNITSSALVRARAAGAVPPEIAECDVPVILSIGRLSRQKGFDMAIDAAKILKGKGIAFRWLVIGNGDLEEELKGQITACQVEDCFRLLGPRENPYPYIRNCTILAQTSRFEGKSIVLDEGKILAAPIVATDYPTVKDQIIYGKEGIITEMTPEGIAGGIERMLKETDLREGIHAYLAGHEYGNQSEAEKYCRLFRGEAI